MRLANSEALLGKPQCQKEHIASKFSTSSRASRLILHRLLLLLLHGALGPAPSGAGGRCAGSRDKELPPGGRPPGFCVKKSCLAWTKKRLNRPNEDPATDKEAKRIRSEKRPEDRGLQDFRPRRPCVPEPSRSRSASSALSRSLFSRLRAYSSWCSRSRTVSSRRSISRM